MCRKCFDSSFCRAFPPPFGVRVLKLEYYEFERRNHHGVSVPFRGPCSEIPTSSSLMSTTIQSFRPLSGFVFWNVDFWDVGVTIACFRPLSGFTFWNVKAVEGMKWLQQLSVPFRGSRSEIGERRKVMIGCLAKLSVPFRGSRSEICEYLKKWIGGHKKFPSPFGVHVLKYLGGLADNQRVA